MSSSDSTAFSQGRGVALVCAALLLAAAPVLRSAHRHTDAWAPRSDLTQEIKYLPTGRALTAASLGYEPLLADLLWVRTVLLFGKNYASEDDDWYSWVFHMCDLATDLDPDFKAAYKYGGTMLRVDGAFIDQSSLLFAKGATHRPDIWEFPFGIAMNYFMFKKDRETAALWMERAALTGDGPFYVRNLAASLKSEAGDLDAALLFLQQDLENIPPSQDKARTAVEVKIFETVYLIAVRDAGHVLQEFRRATGDLPADPSEVVTAGLQLPADPLGGRWTWDPDPEAEIGTVISTRYCEVFKELAETHGLGRMSYAGCTAEDVED